MEPKKSIQLGLRADALTKQHLDEICKQTYRNQSDVIRYLIEKEWQALQSFPPTPRAPAQ